MPRGASDIPALRLEVLQGVMSTFMSAPKFFLMNFFTILEDVLTKWT